MESFIPVNDFLKNEITRLDHRLIPTGCEEDARTLRMIQESLTRIIDSLGVQSATAQGLTKAITSSEKLRNSPTQLIYLLKDAAAKNGRGEVIGFLKVSYKHLYLFNDRDKVCQVEPLCVLDFYVSSERQRRGNGKKLFDYMLEDTATQPHELAVDGPSQKMETFLAKNYGVDRLIRQSNNFAVSSAFFASTPCTTQSGRTTPVLPTAAVGRFAARPPPSCISDIIHGAKELHFETKNGTPHITPEETTSAAPSRAPSPRPQLSPRRELSPRRQPSPEPEREPVLEALPGASSSLERPTTLSVAPATSASPPRAGSVSPRRKSQQTDRGYFDLKYYHNKLW